MLTAFKHFLRLVLVPTLYIGGLFVMIAAIFKKVEWGLLLMVFLIPQPNIWYKFHDYPFGKDYMDLLFFSIVLGILFQRKGFARTANSTMIVIFIMISYVALWNTSLRFSLPWPITTSNLLLPDWKNYAEMILLYFLALNAVKDEDHQKMVVVVMSIVVLLIAVRSYRNFSGGVSFDVDKRDGGPFEAVGLGPNHLGAFIAYYCVTFLGLFILDTDRYRKYLFLTTTLFGLHPLFFSYSRGAYVAAFGALAFFALVKKRSLIILIVVILLTWQTILPASVVDRIMMTETPSGQLEGSAGHRLDLWEHALTLFEQNPVFGIGFGGFGFTVPQGELTDTHSFYMRMLSEEGIIGLAFFLLIFIKAFVSGWRLYKTGDAQFHRGLGLGFMGTVIACMISNLFGDRWSYFALGGYFWILWGLVDRGIILATETRSTGKVFSERTALIQESDQVSPVHAIRQE